MATPDTYPVTMTDTHGHDYPVFDASGYVNSVYSLGHHLKNDTAVLSPEPEPPSADVPSFDTPDTPAAEVDYYGYESTSNEGA